MEHDESKLPKWAQARLGKLRVEVERLKGLEKAHPILIGREWYTIPGPPASVEFPRDVRKLWTLDFDQPFPVCSIYYGDVLLIGRSRHRWGGSPVPVADGCGGELKIA